MAVQNLHLPLTALFCPSATGPPHSRQTKFRLTRPPKALLKARMDNIAIVPASMLPLTQTLREKANTLPKGGVFLCYAAENTRQRKLLERVGETFREQGHPVINRVVPE